jgi:hypothetical protein
LGVNVNEGPKYKDKNYVPWRLYQSNHGGIVEYHGQEYLFYHTSALSSWRQDEFKGWHMDSTLSMYRFSEIQCRWNHYTCSANTYGSTTGKSKPAFFDLLQKKATMVTTKKPVLKFKMSG